MPDQVDDIDDRLALLTHEMRYRQQGDAFRPPNAGNDLSESFWQHTAPNALSLMRGEPWQPPNVQPGYVGKIPSADDPRPMNALVEALSFSRRPGTGVLSMASEGLSNVLKGSPLARRILSMYNAPPRNWPFAADYPAGHMGIPDDGQAGTALTHGIRGHPLHAKYVVGRQVYGGDDVPLPQTAHTEITKAFTGRDPIFESSKKMGGDYGQTRVNKVTGRPESVTIDRELLDDPHKLAMVHAHENAHVIDVIAGRMPTAGLVEEEFKPLFNTLNNGNRAKGGLEASPTAKKVTPKSQGYEGEEIPREYVAEAVRAYFENPSYVKAMAPRVAARIQDFFNSHPEVSKIIQFNALAAGVGYGTYSGQQSNALSQ